MRMSTLATHTLIIAIATILVETIVTDAFFNGIIDQSAADRAGRGFYTRAVFLQAAGFYPQLGTTEARREIAAFYLTHDTGYMCFIEERDPPNYYCDRSYPEWPCTPNVAYYERDPLQLSHAGQNQLDLQAQRDQDERHQIADSLDPEIKRWAAGKEGNLRALLSTLQYVLWPECGWQPVSLTDLIVDASVKKTYRKATLCIHPDKVEQQKGATLQQKYVAETVFGLLKEAWNKFQSEELFSGTT